MASALFFAALNFQPRQRPKVKYFYLLVARFLPLLVSLCYLFAVRVLVIYHKKAAQEVNNHTVSFKLCQDFVNFTFKRAMLINSWFSQ